MSIGVPIKVLYEAEGHVITCETKTGETYRGKLVEVEDSMNCHMSGVSVTDRDGKQATVPNVYIQGSNIQFLILPDMLNNAPMFIPKKKNSTSVVGKSAVLRAHAARARGRGRGCPSQGWQGRPNWQGGSGRASCSGQARR